MKWSSRRNDETIVGHVDMLRRITMPAAACMQIYSHSSLALQKYNILDYRNCGYAVLFRLYRCM